MSLELTRTKELVDRYEEDAESLKQNSRDNEQTITDIQKNEGNDRPSFLGTEAKMVKTEMSGGFTIRCWDLTIKL